MKNSWSTERCSQKYQCILRGNGAQPFNGSREIVIALVPGAVRNWAMKQGAPNIIIE